MNAPTKTKDVCFVPAKCSRCLERLAWVAVPPEQKGTVILVTTKHNCKADNGQKS